MTEGRNTGIPKIKRALKNNGSKEPEFETNEDRDYFITTIFMHNGFKNENSNKNEVINEVISGVIKFGKNEMKVLNLIKENVHITKKEICHEIGLSKSTTDRVISSLKEKVAIKRIGSNKNGYWEIINKNSSKNEIINEVISGVIKFGKNEMKVLNLIKENVHITKKEICHEIGLSKSTTDRVISSLKAKDAIKRIGSNKNGYWKIIIDNLD